MVGVGLFLLLSGGGPEGITDFIGGNEPVPEFDFVLGKPSAFEVTQEHHTKLDHLAEDVAVDVNEQIDLLYTAAFLDPNNWQDGAYDDVWDLFADQAAVSAQEQAEVLTLGTAAGKTFQKVEPDTGKLKVEVLFDAEGQPATAVASVRFRAIATAKGGASATAIVSGGQYFLQDLGDGWQIISFDVDRADREAKAPTPSGSASPETS